jgi:hypothetical protein
MLLTLNGYRWKIKVLLPLLLFARYLTACLLPAASFSEMDTVFYGKLDMAC